MKQTNVIPGDRAILIRSTIPDNLGVLVDVVSQYAGEKLPDGTWFNMATDRVYWVIESLGRKLVCNGPSGMLTRHQVAVTDDRSLRRLPDINDEDETLKTVEPVLDELPA